MAKLLFLREALRKYDRVLLLDDTCYVTPDTPNLFDLVPPEELGVAPELGELRHCAKFNSGVLLAGRWFLGILEDLPKLHKDLQGAIARGDVRWCGADQTLLNYAVGVRGTKIFYLDPRFNVVSSNITPELLSTRDAYVFHMTGTNLERTKRFVAELTKYD